MDSLDDESVGDVNDNNNQEIIVGEAIAQSKASNIRNATTLQSLRSNGQTVVFTSVANTQSAVKHAVSQAIAVPHQSGGVSIVQLVPNQPNVVQSVIQPNQQSVIQATGGASAVSGTTLQALQLQKGGNVILLNKLGQLGQGSVIQSTDGSDVGLHQQVQILQAKSDEIEAYAAQEDDARKRREILARRPSYRKILNDLSSTDVVAIPGEIKQEEDGDSSNTATITVGGTSYLKVLPSGAIQLGSQDGTIQGLQTLTMTNAGTGGNAIVQYATQGQDGQFYVPVTVSAADLQAYQIRASTGNASGAIGQGVVMTSTGNIQSGHVIVEEASKKRELRLLKNREAAKECRRKKKEYIKCLENRVAVLENQNKALIEELKSLKELYCQKTD